MQDAPLELVGAVLVQRRRREPRAGPERVVHATLGQHRRPGDPVGPRRQTPAVPLGVPRRHRPPRRDEPLAPLDQCKIGIPRVVEPLANLVGDQGFGESCHRIRR